MTPVKMNVEWQELYRKAGQHAQAGDYAIAAGLYRQASLSEPGAAFLHLQAAYAFIECKQWHDAVTECESALQIEPDSEIAYRALGLALRFLGQPTESESAFRQSLNLAPAKTTYIYLGTLLLEQDRLAEAEKCFNDAIKIDPGFDEAYFNLGHALSRQGLHEKAIQTLSRAIELNSDYGLAHRDLGIEYYQLGIHQEAYRHLKRSLELEPADSIAKEMLVTLQEQCDSHERG